MASRLRTTPLLPLFALVLLGAGWAYGNTNSAASQSSFGSTFFNASPPCPVKKFPTFESVAPIPAIIDPFEEDFVPIFCEIRVDKNGNGVKNGKGKYTTELYVLDHETGQTSTFSIDSGRFKTNESGFADIDVEIPTDLFADGFESGDVSAWSYTRADFTNKKKATNATMSCGTSSSR